MTINKDREADRYDDDVQLVLVAMHALCEVMMEKGMNLGTVLSVITVEAYSKLIERRYDEQGREAAMEMALSILKNAVGNSGIPVEINANHYFTVPPSKTLQ